MTRIEQLLAENHTPPQRYGTAFHVTPPVGDVRELDPADFANESSTKGLLSPATLEHFFEQEISDPYLLWHLAHADRLPIRFLTVPAGAKEELTFTATPAQTSEILVITLEAGATLDVVDERRELSLLLRHVRVTQHENSTLRWWAVRSGLTFTHERTTIDLVGPHAQAQFIHLVSGNGQSQYDGEVVVNHVSPDTTADVRLRTTVNDTAAVLYRGRLTVGRAARGTAGYQQGRALMLSPNAVADLLPQLDIGTNDVKCSHGVSTLHLDDTALFYLRSRGLPEAEARRLAILGFWHDQLEIPQPLMSVVSRLSA